MKSVTFATAHFCVQLFSVRLLGDCMGLDDQYNLQRRRVDI